MFFVWAFAVLSLWCSASGLTLDDLWNNNAHFEFVSKAQFPTTPGGEYGMNVGFQFVTREVNNISTWFLFHREYAFTTQPSYCQYDFARIVVQNSTDQGVTWSDKVMLVVGLISVCTDHTHFHRSLSPPRSQTQRKSVPLWMEQAFLTRRRQHGTILGSVWRAITHGACVTTPARACCPMVSLHPILAIRCELVLINVGS